MSEPKNSPKRDIPLKIRPHHGLCSEFFRGEGYSGEFSRNMGNILAYLRENVPPIILVNGVDEICTRCPNLVNGTCSGEKAEKYDESVLELCGFSCGEELNWKDFVTAVREKIISKGKLPHLCGDCQWFYICGTIIGGDPFEAGSPRGQFPEPPP